MKPRHRKKRLLPQKMREATQQAIARLGTEDFWLHRFQVLLGYCDGLARRLFDLEGNCIGECPPRVKDLVELEDLALEVSGRKPELGIDHAELSDIKILRRVEALLVTKILPHLPHPVGALYGTEIIVEQEEESGPSASSDRDCSA